MFQYIGSSPRLWGTVYPFRSGLPFYRFIPTLVGNSFYQPLLLLGFAVHPHACGEQYLGRKDVDISGGSSPRLWGTERIYRTGNN